MEKKWKIALAAVLALSLAANAYLGYLAYTMNGQLETITSECLMVSTQMNDLQDEMDTLRSQHTALQGEFHSIKDDYITIKLEYKALRETPTEIDLSGVNDAVDKLLNGDSSESSKPTPPATPSRPAGATRDEPDWDGMERVPEDEKGGDIAIGGNPTTDHGNPFDR